MGQPTWLLNSCLLIATNSVVYDTLRLKHRGGVDERKLDYLASTLQTPNYTLRRGITTIKGTLRNLNVTANPAGVTLQGSAATFLQGSNVKTFPWEDTPMFLDAVSDALQIDFWEADIYRADIAATFEVEAPVQAYLHQLGDLPGLTRTHHRNTLYYGSKNNALSLAIYDKAKEAKLYTQGNLLRPEVRIHRKHALERLGIFTGEDLTNEATQRALLELYTSKLDAIKRKPPIMIDARKILTPTDAVNAFIAQYREPFHCFVEQVQASGGLQQRHNYRRAKEKAYEAGQLFTAQGEGLIEELERKYHALAA